MKRKNIDIDGRKLSYLDNEKPGQAMICLHGHFGCAAMWSFMEGIHPGRLILVDQRGHGESDRASTYRTADYVDDLSRLVAHEAITHPILVGHSLGGVNAYSYAALHREVKALIIEDIGTEVDCSNEFIRRLPSRFNSLYEVQEAFSRIQLEFDQYFLESLRYDGQSWRFNFDYEDMVQSQLEMNGSHWAAWDILDCPILLLHGSKSWACKTDNLVQMAARNRFVTLKVYEGAGHTLHDECRARFGADVAAFVQKHGN